MTSHPSPVILLVEDDDAIRDITAMLLEDEGYLVTTAASGDAASEWLADHHADVLFTDVRMPGKIDGRALIEQHLARPMQLLVTSGELREQHDWIPPHAHYLSKPYDRKTLLATLRPLLDKTRA